jgi:hypothetical protein
MQPGLAVERSREDPGARGLADATGTCEDERLRDPAAADRVLQRLRDPPLPDGVVETLGTPLAREDLEGH